MNQMYNKTDNPKRKAGRAVPHQDRHNHSFKSGLLSRLCCAALALLLAFGGVSALRGSFDGLLPVVHAETHWDRTIATGATNKEFDGEYPRVIEINVDANTTMLIKDTAKINIGRDSGSNDASEIQVYTGATLNLEGEITGTAERLTVSRYNDASLNVFLNKGAVFDVVFDKEYSGDLGNEKRHSAITCYGSNYGCGSGGSVAATDKDGDAIINSGAQSELTKNVFYIYDPGKIYIITATPDAGYSVVWSKGPRGEILQTTQRTLNVTDCDGKAYNDTYTMVEVDGNTVKIHLMENAKYKVYANFIPDPKWEWDENNNAKLTISSYSPHEEDGIKETVIYGNVTSTTVPATGTEDGSVTYTATVNYNGEEYNDDKTVTIPALGNHSNDYAFTDDSLWDWTKGSDVGMPVTLENTIGDDNQTYGKLQKVSVDGTELTKKDKDHSDGQFRAAAGSADSIDFMFLPGYLETLTVGEHQLVVELTDGTVRHKFTVHAANSDSGDDSNNSNTNNTNNGTTNNSNDKGKGDWNPKTADNNFRLFLAGWFFMASAGTIVMLLFRNRRKRYSHR